MPRTSDKFVKKDVLISHTPKLQADVREQRKIQSFKMIVHALERRFEENNKNSNT